jgi:hypothetical protein
MWLVSSVADATVKGGDSYGGLKSRRYESFVPTGTVIRS